LRFGSVNLVPCSFHVFREQAGIFQLDGTSTVNEETIGEGHPDFTIRSSTLYFKANNGPSVDLLMTIDQPLLQIR